MGSVSLCPLSRVASSLPQLEVVVASRDDRTSCESCGSGMGQLLAEGDERSRLLRRKGAAPRRSHRTREQLDIGLIATLTLFLERVRRPAFSGGAPDAAVVKQVSLKNSSFGIHFCLVVEASCARADMCPCTET